MWSHSYGNLVNCSASLQQHLHDGCVTLLHCQKEWSPAKLHIQSASLVIEWEFSSPQFLDLLMTLVTFFPNSCCIKYITNRIIKLYTHTTKHNAELHWPCIWLSVDKSTTDFESDCAGFTLTWVDFMLTGQQQKRQQNDRWPMSDSHSCVVDWSNMRNTHE